jgi:ABC-type uncharacterized transport system involved in gliding motility auxiliary subunit
MPGGSPVGVVTADNVDLLKNAIESAAGGKELMNIRVRGKTSRPFERVQEIQRDADQHFLATQKEWEAKVQDADRRLNELQKAKSSEGSEELVTAEQRKEEDKVREEFVQARKNLREVERQRREDTQSLGTTLKVLNIGLMPLLVLPDRVRARHWRARRRKRS